MNLNMQGIKLAIENEIPFPKMVTATQSFQTNSIEKAELSSIIKGEFTKEIIQEKILPGMRIAIGVGSRGIENLSEIVSSIVKELKLRGAEPFIVPAMGSHGGGSAEGQKHVLEKLGIYEESVGCPVRASMDTVLLGVVQEDVDVYFDKLAYEEADGVIVVSRIKPHTDFKGPIESGIHKMLGIGLGKHKGASYLHRGGMGDFSTLLEEAGQLIITKTPFLFGVGIVEDSNHQTAYIELIPKEKVLTREKELLLEAKKLMAKFWLDEIDVLIIDEIGKNISGSGLDPNVVGRTGNSKFKGEFGDAPEISKIVILGLTSETDGNGNGIGLADFSTKQTIEQIDFQMVYTNAITAIEIGAGKLPIILSNDKEAIAMAIYTAGKRDLNQVKVVRIKNTLELGNIEISENMVPDVENHLMVTITGKPQDWQFDENGQLLEKS